MIEYYTIATIALLAAISPGPDYVVVVNNVLTHHRRCGIFASLGIGVGILIHSTYCILGLAVIISQSVVLFNVIKLLGASYLIYLGIKSLISRRSHLPQLIHPSDQSHSNWQAFKDGLLVNLLNPKCTLFILSVFTMIVKPNTSVLTQSIYGLEISVITALWFLILSFGLGIQAIKNKLNPIQHLVTKLIGVVLLVLGLSIVIKVLIM